MSYQEIELTRIRPSKMNPRKAFEGPKFDELVDSVRKKGVLQPIVVRLIDPPGGPSFEIVAGERRWRAMKQIAAENGKDVAYTIPAMVRDLTEDEAFEVMTIENLQREDLSEREEAEGFKAYLKRKGEEALPELALKTSIDPRYIRRRVRILSLPKEVLKAWEDGKLKYGHLEQLRRLEDPEQIKGFFKEVLRRESSVEYLKSEIDRISVPLGKAQFKTSEAGCKTCPSNSAFQKDLFGMDTGKASCLNPECFKDHSVAWLTANWDQSSFKKNFGTNGFRLFDYGQSGRLSYEGFYGENPKKECKACKDFVSLLSARNVGEVHHERACVNPACYRKTFQIKRSLGRQTDPKERAEKRAETQGVLFREEFFKERIPRAIESVDQEDKRVDYLALASLLYSNRRLHGWFFKSLPPDTQNMLDQDAAGEPPEWYELEPEEIWKALQNQPLQFVRLLLRDAAGQAIMQPEFRPEGRYQVGRSLGMDLAKEWRIHESYLQAKTKAEILDIGDKLGITSDVRALTFLTENLHKKGSWGACKKGELIRVFLESGVDLAGKVPEEILVKEQKCRVCGCDDDHACPGGCFWVEPDLCSACAGKKKGRKKGKPK